VCGIILQRGAESLTNIKPLNTIFLNIKSCVLAAITLIMIRYAYMETSMKKHSLSENNALS
jgi:hypothetical protein